MAKITAKAERMQQVMERLSQVVTNTEQGAFTGLMAGGILIIGRSMREVPVEHGFLRASAFIRKAQDGSTAVEVGYSQKYALAVHEATAEKLRGQPRPSGLGTYWNPGKSKYLEDPFNRSIKEVVKLVKANAKQRRSR